MEVLLHAALKVAQRLARGDVVLLFADGGWKYLASPPQAGEGEELDDMMWW